MEDDETQSSGLFGRGSGIRHEGGGRGERCKLTHCVRLCPICLCICGVSALNIS